MTNEQKMIRLEEVRGEFVTRMQALNALSGKKFKRTADALEAWISEVNGELNSFAQEQLGEPLAIDGEALLMLRMMREQV